MPCYFFLRVCMQPSGKRTISCNSPGSCLATGRTSVGHDLTTRNSEERIRQNIILPSMIPIKNNKKNAAQKISRHIYLAREQCFVISYIHIPSWSYLLDRLAQYNEHRLLLLYYVIINYLRLHVKLNFNDLLSFCLHGLSWKLGVLSFWWISFTVKI